MKRKQILRTVLPLFVVLLSATATPALAQAKLVFVGNLGMASVPHPDPPMMVEFVDIERSPCGRADCLTIEEIDPDTGEPIPVAAVTDNECFKGFMEAMFEEMGYPDVEVVLVDDEQLEVWKRGRTLYAELTVSVGDIHPISVEIKGLYGKPMKMEESETMPDGSEMTMTIIGYEALAYFGDPCPPMWAMTGKFQMKVTPP